MLMKCKLLIFNINIHKLNTNYSGILFLEIRGSLMEIRVEEKNWDFVFDRMNVFAMQIIDFQHKFPKIGHELFRNSIFGNSWIIDGNSC